MLGGGGCRACFPSGSIFVGGGRGSKRSAPLFPGPQGAQAHGLHPRLMVAEIWADPIWSIILGMWTEDGDLISFGFCCLWRSRGQWERWGGVGWRGQIEANMESLNCLLLHSLGFIISRFMFPSSGSLGFGSVLHFPFLSYLEVV